MKKKFIFHLQILEDQHFIEGQDKGGLGYSITPYGKTSWSVIPLRLTAQGHEFIESIQNKEIWNTIKSDFKGASLNTLWSVSKQLLESYTKKKVESLISNM